MRKPLRVILYQRQKKAKVEPGDIDDVTLGTSTFFDVLQLFKVRSPQDLKKFGILDRDELSVFS